MSSYVLSRSFARKWIPCNSFNISLGVTGFYVHVDDNGDSEFNMTLLDFVQTADGELGEFCLSLKNLYKAGNL